ncbi:CDP-glycerol glycerophosphotransferase family protein [Nocardioides sp. CGMCC 1.13656]|uniref:CDP-glycerol glycerophosphotransferase family protein n=1 Tax=Nocardioides TaxID=1839 RepID=UPI0012F8573A|nr:CDP-glycerol glycerophosphotransferase family protein [Nocardioides sp. CGMCC 1.13656]MBA2954551.1 CDP-glycerol glycerophosphotransferase family protein [Nocardioides sp. CGMCC 1.13656]
MNRLLTYLIGLINQYVPKSSSVLLVGTPPEEANIVEIGRQASRWRGGRVYWVDAPDDDYLAALGIRGQDIVRILSRHRGRVLWRFLRARIVFFTHGVLGQPAPAPTQLVVNLWHGEGPKGGGKLFPTRRLKSQPASMMVGQCSAMSDYMADLGDIDPGRMRWLGYPRSDQLRRGVAAERLEALGIERPYVVWMPTYRRAGTPEGGVAWSNTTDVASDEGLGSGLVDAVGLLQDQGLAVIVKPHPLDIVNREVPGAITIDDGTLRRAGIGLYELLGSAAGLISDYSAVWVDFLVTDRPIAFHVADEPAFRSGRGALPPAFDMPLPGPDLSAAGALEDFIRDLSGTATAWPAERARVRAALGLHEEPGSAERVWRTVLSELRRCGGRCPAAM